MKKWIWFIFACVSPAFAWAEGNNIKMVTYFPVPYAAYNDLGVLGSCDVGLGSSCVLNADQGLSVKKNTDASDTRALNSGSLILKKGKLALNSTSSDAMIQGRTLSVGSGMEYMPLSDLTFTDFRVDEVVDPLASVQSDNGYTGVLQLAGHTFPSCSEGEITWKKLTFNDTTGVFLTCGEGVAEEPECYGDTYYDSDSGLCQCYDSSAVWYEGYCCTYDDKSYPCWDSYEDWVEGECYTETYESPYEWAIVDYLEHMAGGPLGCYGGDGSGCNFYECNEDTAGNTCNADCYYDGDEYGGMCFCNIWKCTKGGSWTEDWCEEGYYTEEYYPNFDEYGSSYYDPKEYPYGY